MKANCVCRLQLLFSQINVSRMCYNSWSNGQIWRYIHVWPHISQW